MDVCGNVICCVGCLLMEESFKEFVIIEINVGLLYVFDVVGECIVMVDMGVLCFEWD